MASILKANVPPPRPPIRYAAAAAAAVAPPPVSSVSTVTPPIASTSGAAHTSGQPQTPLTPAASQGPSLSDSSPSLTHPSAISPMLSSTASASQQPDGSFYSDQESPIVLAARVSSPDVITIPPVDQKDKGMWWDCTQELS